MKCIHLTSQHPNNIPTSQQHPPNTVTPQQHPNILTPQQSQQHPNIPTLQHPNIPTSQQHPNTLKPQHPQTPTSQHPNPPASDWLGKVTQPRPAGASGKFPPLLGGRCPAGVERGSPIPSASPCSRLPGRKPACRGVSQDSRQKPL